MITAETMADALLTGERRLDLGDGWFSNGYFAVRGEEWAKLGKEKKHNDSPAKWAALADRVPVAEDLSLRIPGVRGKENCDSCGDGACECHCGHKHVCQSCDGDGTVDVTEDIGQMVFVGEGVETVVNPLLGALLEGLTVVRTTNDDAACAMLLGLDEHGELVAAVMPLRGKVRRPETKP